MINPSPAEPGYALSLQKCVDPDQLASDLELIWIKKSDWLKI